jgi:hypothetical protein
MVMAKKYDKTTAIKSRKKSPHVPNHYGGFSLQETRLTARLLEADPGSVLSLEVFEDVGVDLPDGTRIAEQSKSSLDGNPVSDRAVDLWKTLSNWVEAVIGGELDPTKTRFELYVSKPVTGSIVASFSRASSKTEALAALEETKTRLWGLPPAYAEKAKLADSICDYVNLFLGADQDITCAIITAFSFIQGSGIPQDDFENVIRNKFVSEENVKPVADQAIGWVKSRTDKLIQQGKPAYVNRDEFFDEMTAFVRRIDRQNILRSLAPDPTPNQIDQDIAARTYVRQLQIIDTEYERQVEAVTDYLRSSADRTIWSARGLVHKDSFTEFERDLRSAWQNLKTEADLTCINPTEVNKGRLLYSKCCRHTATLQNMDISSSFTRGSFHTLAEDKIIGWHPDYKSKL